MQFNVVFDDDDMYSISFVTDEVATFCNIYDDTIGCVISSGHSILGDGDNFDMVEGMKLALKRALNTTPVLFTKSTRSTVWEVFWEVIDNSVLRYY